MVLLGIEIICFNTKLTLKTRRLKILIFKDEKSFKTNRFFFIQNNKRYLNN